MTAARTTLAAVAALVMAAGSGSAQAAMGLKAGANLASLTGAADADAITGLTAGAYLGLGVGDRLALQLEATYAVRGGDAVRIGANALDDGAPPSDVRLSYVEVPLLLRAGYPGERLLPSIFMGPYAAFLLSCRITLEDGSEGDCDDDARSAWFQPRSTDYGLMAGGGLDFALGESTVFVDVRYVLGLLSIHGGDAMDLRHRGPTITGGFAIPLGR